MSNFHTCRLDGPGVSKFIRIVWRIGTSSGFDVQILLDDVIKNQSTVAQESEALMTPALTLVLVFIVITSA